MHRFPGLKKSVFCQIKDGEKISIDRVDIVLRIPRQKREGREPFEAGRSRPGKQHLRDAIEGDRILGIRWIGNRRQLTTEAHHTGKGIVQVKISGGLTRLVWDLVHLEPPQRSAVCQEPADPVLFELERIDQRKKFMKKADRVILRLIGGLRDRCR